MNASTTPLATVLCLTMNPSVNLSTATTWGIAAGSAALLSAGTGLGHPQDVQQYVVIRPVR